MGWMSEIGEEIANKEWTNKVQKLINDLEEEREDYGDRIVSLSYAYDSALEKLCKLIGVKFEPYEEVD